MEDVRLESLEERARALIHCPRSEYPLEYLIIAALHLVHAHAAWYELHLVVGIIPRKLGFAQSALGAQPLA